MNALSNQENTPLNLCLVGLRISKILIVVYWMASTFGQTCSDCEPYTRIRVHVCHLISNYN